MPSRRSVDGALVCMQEISERCSAHVKQNSAWVVGGMGVPTENNLLRQSYQEISKRTSLQRRVPVKISMATVSVSVKRRLSSERS